MQDITPLYVDIDLPEGALLRDDAAQASVVDACHPNDAQAIWYHAHAPAMTFNAQKAMTQWAAENGLGSPARPVDPNDDNGTLLEGGGVQREGLPGRMFPGTISMILGSPLLSCSAGPQATTDAGPRAWSWRRDFARFWRGCARRSQSTVSMRPLRCCRPWSRWFFPRLNRSQG